MEFIKQLWETSGAFRIVLCLMVVGAILALSATDPSAPAVDNEPTVVDKVRDSIPLGTTGPLDKAGAAADGVLDVFNSGVQAAGKGVEAADRTLDDVLNRP